jgi:hypothetical protein
MPALVRSARQGPQRLDRQQAGPVVHGGLAREARAARELRVDERAAQLGACLVAWSMSSSIRARHAARRSVTYVATIHSRLTPNGRRVGLTPPDRRVYSRR